MQKYNDMHKASRKTKDREPPPVRKHDTAVPYKREPFDWKRELEQEEQDNGRT